MIQKQNKKYKCESNYSNMVEDQKNSHSNSQAKWIHESCWNSYGVSARFNGK